MKIAKEEYGSRILFGFRIKMIKEIKCFKEKKARQNWHSGQNGKERTQWQEEEDRTEKREDWGQEENGENCKDARLLLAEEYWKRVHIRIFKSNTEYSITR